QPPLPPGRHGLRFYRLNLKCPIRGSECQFLSTANRSRVEGRNHTLVAAQCLESCNQGFDLGRCGIRGLHYDHPFLYRHDNPVRGPSHIEAGADRTNVEVSSVNNERSRTVMRHTEVGFALLEFQIPTMFTEADAQHGVTGHLDVATVLKQ